MFKHRENISISGEIERRDLLVSAAAAFLAVALLPSESIRQPRPIANVDWNNVNWDRVLGRVLAHRNALAAGAASSSKLFEVGSPECSMEEALAAGGLLAKGEAIHV